MGTTRKAAVLGALLAVMTSVPASASAEFEDSTVPAGEDVTLGLNVHDEREDGVLERVAVELPAGFELYSCDVAPNWGCEAEPAGYGRPAFAAFFQQTVEGGGGHSHGRAGPRQGGGDPPAPGAQPPLPTFHFTVRTATEPGDYGFALFQYYAGEQDGVEGPPVTLTVEG